MVLVDCFDVVCCIVFLPSLSYAASSVVMYSSSSLTLYAARSGVHAVKSVSNEGTARLVSFSYNFFITQQPYFHYKMQKGV